MSAPHLVPLFCRQCGAPVADTGGPAVECAFCGTVLHRTGAEAPSGALAATAPTADPDVAFAEGDASPQYGDDDFADRIVDGNRFGMAVFGLILTVPILGGALAVTAQAIAWAITTSNTGARALVLVAGLLALVSAGWMVFWLRRLGAGEGAGSPDSDDNLSAGGPFIESGEISP